MPSCARPRYGTRSRGATIASALNATAGAAIRSAARNACSSSWTSGWFWQFVPSRFHRNGAASRRSTSTPTARQPEHRLGHRHEHVRVRVVEVPLIAVERGPEPRLVLVGPGERARRGVREHVGERALVRVGLRPVRERAQERPVARPRVLGRDVVEDEVDAQRHPGVAQVGGQRRAGRPSSPATARPRRSRRPRSRRRWAPAAPPAAASGAGRSRPARAGTAAARARRTASPRTGPRRSRSRRPARAGASPA